MVKFKNRYNGKIINMDIYEKLSIDAQWDYDILQPDTQEYAEHERLLDGINDVSVSGANEIDRDTRYTPSNTPNTSNRAE